MSPQPIASSQMDKSSSSRPTQLPYCNTIDTNNLDASIEKNKKKIVLNEDEYLDRMAYIIRRDFYPDDLHSVVSNSQLRPGRQSASIRSTFADGCTTTTGRYRFYSPGSTVISNRFDDQVRSLEEDANLDQFLSTHNSEDNMLYEDTKQQERILHKSKHPWLYAKSSLVSEANNQTRLPSIEEQSSIGCKDKINHAITWPKRNLPVKQDSPSHSNGFNRCSTINYFATRIKDDLFREPTEPVSDSLYSQSAATIFARKVGIDGRSMRPGETPRVGGYSFVPMTPKVDPSECPTDSKKINSTNTPQYKVPSTPDRELLAHELADRIGRSKRTMSARYNIKQSPYSMRSTDGRLSALSPAARNLSSRLHIKRER